METVTSKDFKAKVMQSSLPVVVVTWGIGWGFCRALKPQVEAFAAEYEDKVGFFDLPAGPNRELLIELDVSGLPTFLFYKNGREFSWLAGRNILIEEIVDHTDRLIEA